MKCIIVTDEGSVVIEAMVVTDADGPILLDMVYSGEAAIVVVADSIVDRTADQPSDAETSADTTLAAEFSKIL